MADRALTFSKYSGAGNDFIMVDDREERVSRLIENDPSFTKRVTCRRRGIGADGLILLQMTPEGVCRMRIFNADGSEAEMCGNGLRCFKEFAEECGIHENPLCVKTHDRLLTATAFGDLIEITLGEARWIERGISLSYENLQFKADFINTGVPHLVCYIKEIEGIDVEKMGAYFRYHPRFAPLGTNVNFIEDKEATSRDSIWKVRTYERGVEMETWACGTGSSAAAISLCLRHAISPPISLQTRGGDILIIDFRQEGDRIEGLKLTGAVKKIYCGKMELT